MTKVVERAIDLARERNAPLVLVHVLDPEFLESRAHMPKSTEEALEHLGELLLEQCKAQCAEARVDAETVIRRGSLVDELADAVRRSQASVLVVGKRKHNFLTTRYRSPWAELQEETGVVVEVVK